MIEFSIIALSGLCLLFAVRQLGLAEGKCEAARRLRHTLVVLILWPPATTLAQSPEEISVAKATLSSLQGISFNNDTEYCGYLAYDPAGKLVATPAQRGDNKSCVWDQAENGLVLVLSYHTHGRFDPEYSSEVPSVADIEADEDEGIDGFVSTPGGRLWYVDTERMEVRQICDIGCLPKDPSFVPGLEGEISSVYSYEDLLEYESD
ncbi:DUF4329 domain-containing protein [Ruegeria sp. HKCCD6157]|uniref:DUF4329 domain-containing protein n=1 Tax=Ruegeria sp. HKCCD6157 TaxID=2690707 RepID=UPI001491EA7B|nr:DUF4329 domain-containing protein [Ruegeria sp. HKCCD6157]NOE25101.1 DUF4329 domain-containing protein [Ruegeria sp. HKCCD6157]